MTKNVSFIRMYLYSLLSVSLWVVLLYMPYVASTPRGLHLSDCTIYPFICCSVLVSAFLIVLVYKLFSLMKTSRLKRDILFCLCISYWYLPFSLFTIYQQGVHVLFNIRLYMLGVAVLPVPFLFVYLLRRAKR